jgi:hypothetical protein
MSSNKARLVGSVKSNSSASAIHAKSSSKAGFGGSDEFGLRVKGAFFIRT